MNYFLEAFRKYADFGGRARRAEFWYFLLFYCLIVIGFEILAYAFNLRFSLVVYTIFSLASIIPSIAVAVRRMHDVGKSGWYCLIPGYNLILALTPGQVGPNQYGPDPKGARLDDHDTTLLDQ